MVKLSEYSKEYVSGFIETLEPARTMSDVNRQLNLLLDTYHNLSQERRLSIIKIFYRCKIDELQLSINRFKEPTLHGEVYYMCGVCNNKIYAIDEFDITEKYVNHVTACARKKHSQNLINSIKTAMAKIEF